MLCLCLCLVVFSCRHGCAEETADLLTACRSKKNNSNLEKKNEVSNYFFLSREKNSRASFAGIDRNEAKISYGMFDNNKKNRNMECIYKLYI